MIKLKYSAPLADRKTNNNNEPSSLCITRRRPINYRLSNSISIYSTLQNLKPYCTSFADSVHNFTLMFQSSCTWQSEDLTNLTKVFAPLEITCVETYIYPDQLLLSDFKKYAMQPCEMCTHKKYAERAAIEAFHSHHWLQI